MAENKPGTETTVFRELGYVVVAEPGDYVVQFRIYQIDVWDSENDAPYFHRAGSISYPDPVANVEEADTYAHGSVKWDGCSNWHFDEQDSAMLHGCSRQHLLDLGLILATCWDMAKTLCKNWDDGVDNGRNRVPQGISEASSP